VFAPCYYRERVYQRSNAPRRMEAYKVKALSDLVAPDYTVILTLSKVANVSR
jgi:hypothetical protein